MNPRRRNNMYNGRLDLGFVDIGHMETRHLLSHWVKRPSEAGQGPRRQERNNNRLKATT
jgi:hypothetical protein